MNKLLVAVAVASALNVSAVGANEDDKSGAGILDAALENKEGISAVLIGAAVGAAIISNNKATGIVDGDDDDDDDDDDDCDDGEELVNGECVPSTTNTGTGTSTSTTTVTGTGTATNTVSVTVTGTY